MEELAARFADLLEGIAIKIRSLTVDRVDRGIRITGLGIMGATLALTAVMFLVWALFGALEIPLSTAGAFAVFAAVLIVIGFYLWKKKASN
jgi:hypothetical protein